MSVGVSVACDAGIAMVTDGRRVARLAGDPPRYELSSDDAQKLFISGGRFAIATYGEAEIGGFRVEDVIDGFAGPGDACCEEYASSLGEHVQELLRYATPPVRGDLLRADALRWSVSFVVAAKDEDCGRVFEVKVRPGKFEVESRLSTANPGVYPFGLKDGIDRFLTGIDMKAMRAARLGIREDRAGDLELLRYDLIYPRTLDEAVEFAIGLIDIQLFAQRFSHGAYARKAPRVAGCGGRIQAVTLDTEATEWQRRDAA